MRDRYKYIRGVLERWGERRRRLIKELGYPMPNFEPVSHQKGIPPSQPGWKPNEFLLKVEISVQNLDKKLLRTAIYRFQEEAKAEEIAAAEKVSVSQIYSRISKIYRDIEKYLQNSKK